MFVIKNYFNNYSLFKHTLNKLNTIRNMNKVTKKHKIKDKLPISIKKKDIKNDNLNKSEDIMMRASMLI